MNYDFSGQNNLRNTAVGKSIGANRYASSAQSFSALNIALSNTRNRPIDISICIQLCEEVSNLIGRKVPGAILSRRRMAENSDIRTPRPNFREIPLGVPREVGPIVQVPGKGPGGIPRGMHFPENPRAIHREMHFPG